jgi:hypothetical protein
MNQNNGEPNTSERLYQDYAGVVEQEDVKAPYSSSKKDPDFAEKLHYMLSEMEKDGLQHIASWQPHGRCFIVHDRKLFTEENLPK